MKARLPPKTISQRPIPPTQMWAHFLEKGEERESERQRERQTDKREFC